jgi:hypothetical protein
LQGLISKGCWYLQFDLSIIFVKTGLFQVILDYISPTEIQSYMKKSNFKGNIIICTKKNTFVESDSNFCKEVYLEIHVA